MKARAEKSAPLQYERAGARIGCQYAEADALHALIREGTLPICREAEMLY